MFVHIDYPRAALSVANAGGTVAFDMGEFANEFVRTKNGQTVYRHLRRIVVDSTFNVVVTDGGGAVKIIDLPALYTFDLVRNKGDRGNTLMYDRMPGDKLLVLEHLRGDGLMPRNSVSPSATADIAANSSGSTVTTAVTLRQVIYLDKPTAKNPKGKAWALSAFARGELSVTVGSIASLWADSHMSLSSHTVTISLECSEHTSLQTGEDFYYKVAEAQSGQTGSVTAFDQIDGGTIDTLVWHVRKIGNSGGEDGSKLSVVDGSKYGLEAEFRSRTGAELIEKAWRSGLDLALRQSSLALFGSSYKAVPLVFVPRHASDFEAILNTPKGSKVKFDLNTGSTLANPHAFIVGYRRGYNAQEHAQAARSAGVVATVPARADVQGPAPSNPAKQNIVSHYFPVANRK